MSEADRGTIHGWGCTPTENHPPAIVASEESTNKNCLPPILTRGWRRNALYCLVIFLIILVFLNIALTLWIISALKLSMNGIGPIKIVKGGIRVDGQVWLVDNLVASTITSQPSQPLTLHSYRNFTVLVTDEDRVEAKLLIKRDSIECSGQTFRVQDSRGQDVFYASKEEVRVSSETLSVNGSGGIVVRSAILAPRVRAPPSFDLELESLTRRLELRAPQSIHLESRAGSIDVTASSHIRLESIVGAIKIVASNIVISNLTVASTTATPKKNLKPKKVYQLCACASGKLFLAPPDQPCAAPDGDTELCR